MSDISYKLTAKSRQELFREFQDLTAHFLRIANSENGRIIHSVNALLAYDWVTRLEFTLDSAGPLGGSLDIFHHGISPIELLRLEPLLPPEMGHNEALSLQFVFFSHIRAIVAHIFRITASSAAAVPALEKLLANGRRLTLQVSFAGYGPVGCSVIIENGDGTVKDIITVAGPPTSERIEFQ